MKQENTYCFIINNASNAYMAAGLFKRREEKIKKYLPRAEFIYVQQEDSIQQLARNKAEEYTHIVACGGDGTVNQVTNGIIGSSAVLGVLPMGSGNDFARQIGLEVDFYNDFKTLLNDKRCRIDVVKAPWGYFLNTFGIGADGLTNYYASQSIFKKGWMRYFAGGLRALLQTKPFDVQLRLEGEPESKQHKTWMVTLANGTTEGGRYTISPASVINDGILEIIVVKNVSRMQLIFEFLKLSMGFSFSKKIIHTYRAGATCSISVSKPVKAHADGEQVPPQTEYRFEIFKEERHVICK